MRIAFVLLIGIIIASLGVETVCLGLTRDVLETVLQATGLEATSTIDSLTLGGVEVEWTDGCSGVHSLLVLLGVAVWTGLRHSWPRFVAAIGLAFVGAIAANVLRVLMIVGYRVAFYPAWEGEELHVLLGYLSLVPVYFLITWFANSRERSSWLEAAYVAVILAMVSSEISEPGGILVGICTGSLLASVASSRSSKTSPTYHAVLIWIFGAIPIQAMRAESLWIPWLLVCPCFMCDAWWRIPSRLLVLLGTIPILVMHPIGQITAVLASGVCVRRVTRTARRVPQDANHASMFDTSPWLRFITAAGISLPLMLPIIWPTSSEEVLPPTGLMAQRTGPDGYRIRMAGQAQDIAIFWYGTQRHGRHHSAATCLQFRGVKTKTVNRGEEILCGGRMWIREFFLLDGRIYDNYSSYVLHCFPPFTSNGIHIVVQSPSELVDYDYFSRESHRLMMQIRERHLRRS